MLRGVKASLKPGTARVYIVAFLRDGSLSAFQKDCGPFLLLTLPKVGRSATLKNVMGQYKQVVMVTVGGL